ncbi:hypothetical protein AKJ41_04000 [candidate division MSBL1 archaeon SCGC-AAA259O05]|uniref:Uncharacterized protein n=1 Tax=candidate division MSBL1 archaeon SCGC-AAA259O05 TaxID=1698271 RepID=A0A133V245_9EURY|nr:hypothetical protein AKJ41_04000 [candidate division MSBL1 archaeon SCGC-AAA259O05]
MKILIGDKGNVDFDEPVEMTKEQKDRFLQFLGSIFSVVEERRVSESRSDRMGDKVFRRKWTIDEYAVLLETEGTSKVAERLGRTWMSVDIQRGSFLPSYMAWAEKKGVDLVQENRKELIEEFLRDKQFVKEARKERRKSLRKLEKELESMEKREKELDIDFLRDEKVITEEDFSKNVWLELQWWCGRRASGQNLQSPLPVPWRPLLVCGLCRVSKSFTCVIIFFYAEKDGEKLYRKKYSDKSLLFGNYLIGFYHVFKIFHRSVMEEGFDNFPPCRVNSVRQKLLNFLFEERGKNFTPFIVCFFADFWLARNVQHVFGNFMTLDNHFVKGVAKQAAPSRG